MSRVVLHRRLTFSSLRRLTGLSSGNLASHLAGLESKGYVRLENAFLSSKPRRVCIATPEGTAAFRTYVNQLRQILDEIGSASQP